MKTKKERIILTITMVLTLGSLFFVPWHALFIYLTPLPDTVQEQLDDTVKQDIDGIIVYIDKKGQPPEFYASGWNDREKKIAADAKSLFKIASITKLYVAAAVAKLSYEEKLSLDKTLSDYLPAIDGRIQYADKITLRMLVQHRSGIPNFTDSPEHSWIEPQKSSYGGIALVFDKPADFEPGSDYGYSNTNYLLIGEIIDKILGYSHERYIEEAILAPLNLNNTYASQSQVDITALSSGYDVGGDFDWKAIEFIGPAGGMIATAEDVGIFIRALNDGSLLNDKEQEIYSSIYGYGHTGLLPGYSSVAHYHKDIDTVVVQFINTSGGGTWSTVEAVYSRILTILRNRNSG